MNPAVAFREVADQARSVVLLSGTLSPLDSFGTELGAAFPHRLEAEHVVPPRQIWAGALSVGVCQRCTLVMDAGHSTRQFGVVLSRIDDKNSLLFPETLAGA